MPSACEWTYRAASMHALSLASGKPSALVDWNNNYGDDPDKCVLFHCGNWATEFLGEPKMAYAEILSTTLGPENTFGTVAGRTPAGPLGFARITTDDRNGAIKAYVGDGEFVDDPLDTFGSRAVVRVPGCKADALRLQKWLRASRRDDLSTSATCWPKRLRRTSAETLSSRRLKALNSGKAAKAAYSAAKPSYCLWLLLLSALLLAVLGCSCCPGTLP